LGKNPEEGAAMPDDEKNTTADPEELPKTPLHAYKEGRTEDVSGDGEKLTSDDPRDHQQRKLEGEDELSLPHEKH
jgi:hypothetical protein